jgi:hypothetical protein
MEMINTLPVESGAASRLVEPIHKHSEGSEPSGAQKKVCRIMHHVVSEWQQPHEAKQERDDGNDLGVDLTTERITVSSMALVMQVELVGHDAKNYLKQVRTGA